jgi:hypothetical protein
MDTATVNIHTVGIDKILTSDYETVSFLSMYMYMYIYIYDTANTIFLDFMYDHFSIISNDTHRMIRPMTNVRARNNDRPKDLSNLLAVTLQTMWLVCTIKQVSLR